VHENGSMRFRFLAAIGALAAFAIAGCSNPTGPAGDYGSIAGVVSDAKTGAPIAGAHVCIFTVECQDTLADGTYKISTVPSDPAGMMESITASAPGYITATLQVHISSGQQTPANFALTHT